MTLCLPVFIIFVAKHSYCDCAQICEFHFNLLPIYPDALSPIKFSIPGLRGSVYLIPTVKYKEMALEISVVHFEFKKIGKQSY